MKKYLLASFILLGFALVFSNAYKIKNEKTPVKKSEPRILYNNPPDAGMNTYVKLLTKAYKEKDGNICNTLPAAKKQSFDHGDYSTQAPTTQQWQQYCRALVTGQAHTCKNLARFTSPNLKANCISFFGGVGMQKHTKPNDCYKSYGTFFIENIQVSHCYKGWINSQFEPRSTIEDIRSSESIEPFTPFDLDLIQCMNKESEYWSLPKDIRSIMSMSDFVVPCFHEHIKNHKDENICDLAPQYSIDACRSQAK